MQLLVELPLERGIIVVLWKQRLAIICLRLTESKAGRHSGEVEVSIGVVQVIAEMVAICEGVRIVGGFHGYRLDVMTQLRRSEPSLHYLLWS
jgi:ribosomal protein L30/L7E